MVMEAQINLWCPDQADLAGCRDVLVVLARGGHFRMPFSDGSSGFGVTEFYPYPSTVGSGHRGGQLVVDLAGDVALQHPTDFAECFAVSGGFAMRSRVRSSWAMRVSMILWSAELAWRLPPRFRRWRWTLPRGQRREPDNVIVRTSGLQRGTRSDQRGW